MLTSAGTEQKKNLIWKFLKIAAIAVGALVVINFLTR